MTDAKKVWEKPELTVLVRNNPEEAVLFFCKVFGKDEGPGEGKCNQGPGGSNVQCESNADS